MCYPYSLIKYELRYFTQFVKKNQTITLKNWNFMSQNQNQLHQQQSLKVIAQYLKDISFENPGMGPLSRIQGKAPEININVHVNAHKNTEMSGNFHVDIHLKAVSKIKEVPLFILETTYTGIFEITGFEPELEEQIVNIQCPALLFPFLRRIVGEKTVDGGYPPLYLDPIDFHAIYLQKIQHESLEENNAGSSSSVFN